MALPETTPSGYSSRVQIALEFNGQSFAVAQIGESSLILQEDVDVIPGSNARVLITVDGRTKAYPIIIDSVVPQHRRIIQFSDWTALSTIMNDRDEVPF
jgi:hypothetical protein